MSRSHSPQKNKKRSQLTANSNKVLDVLLARNQKEDASTVSETKPTNEELAIHFIRESGAFDTNFYLNTNPDLQGKDIDAVSHYFFQGWKEGRNPSYLFESKWYLEKNADVDQSGMNPLIHYLMFGENEGRAPSPYFDPSYYRNQRPGLLRPSSMLAAYINSEWRELNPNEFFDGQFYLNSYQDVSANGMSPLLHYVSEGWRERREINDLFSLEKYRANLVRKNLKHNDPLRYFLEIGRHLGDFLPPKRSTGKTGGAPASSTSLQAEIEKNQKPGPFAEDKLLGQAGENISLKARLFAFYLPQFYPFEQNNAWWGPGFTEWRNVTRAIPRFEGHQQPHLPRELGFYDLRNVETMRQQVAMAKSSGVSGFCFYYYWFNGTRLLDRPLDMLLENKEIDMPFSLMWANENWTRRWDGLENDILMGQDYRETDDEALVADLARYFADPRYERVDNRPLFIIYRPGIIPQFNERLEKWRNIFRNKHAMDPLVLMVLGFGDFDPTAYNVDGAIEFPPHKLAEGLSPINSTLNIIDDEFRGHYLRYDDLLKSSLSVPAPKYDLIRTLVPAWDNDARKPSRGMGFIDSTPEKYEYWLRNLISYAQAHPFRNSVPYVFVNAWNEWAEGSHLEPDLYNGVAYLNATYRALTGIKKKQSASKSILLVGHDAYKHGAQLLTLNIMRTLRQDFGLAPTLILLEGGPLVESYQQFGEVIIIRDNVLSIDEIIDDLLPHLPARTAICNTVVTGEIVPLLAARGFRVVSLIHELSQLITERRLESRAIAVAEHADTVIFASHFVQASFEKITGSLGAKAIVQPQGIYQRVAYEPNRRHELRQILNLPSESKIVLNMGYGDLRKGFDLYVGVAKQVISANPDCHFVWLGNLHGDLQHWLQIDLLSEPLANNFHILPFDDDVNVYLNGADLYALTSREDPFPSVVLEALACGVPVVGFEGGGGYGEAIRREKINGAMVPMADVTAMAQAVLLMLDSDNMRDAETRSIKAQTTYNWRDYVFGLLQVLVPDLKKISVVVPNYNYSQHLPERLNSIFDQEYPIYELIILDDKSTDDSITVTKEILASANRTAKLVENVTNSGSVFKQWQKGTAMASGNLLWIAEADDGCTATFLRDLTAHMTQNTGLAFCDSVQVDSVNQRLGDSYGFYFEDLPDNPMTNSFTMSGSDFLRSALAIKNVILNVSAVLFDRSALEEVFEQHGDTIRSYKVAGDWFIYTSLLSQPHTDVVYVHQSNNVHRRHASSVTHALARQRHIEEIKSVQSVVASRKDIPEAIIFAAARYVDEVAQQFKLDEKNEE